jgi:hypothetical protein
MPEIRVSALTRINRFTAGNVPVFHPKGLLSEQEQPRAADGQVAQARAF